MNSIEDKEMNITLKLNGIITSIIGPTNSGKTTFLKKLCHRIKNASITIDEVCISEYDITFLKNNIVVVFDDNFYHCDYVAEELYYYLRQLGYRIDEITKKIEVISKVFKIEDMLDMRIDMLSVEHRILVKILSYLIIKPKIFALDNLFGYLSEKRIQEIIKYCRNNQISLIFATSKSDELLLSDEVIIMHNYKAILCADVKSVLNGNTILPYMGIKLPFIVDLSHNLILYELVDKIYYDKRKLVDKLWK